MKFIVTGGAGFIGHNVVRQLEALGHECFILDSITDYGFINNDELSYLKRERVAQTRAGVHHIDLRNHEAVTNFFRTFSINCDAVIHLASFPRQKAVANHPLWASDVMSTSLVHLLESTKAFRIPKFVYISSSMIYGDFADGVKEDAICKPQGQYGIMKLMGEQLVQDYSRRGIFNTTVIRPSAVYGERDVEDRVVSKFVLGALRGNTLLVNGATEKLDFTNVQDTAAGIVKAVVSSAANNKIYNITRSKAHSLLDAAELIVNLVGKGTIKVMDRDMNFPQRGSLDITAAKQDLNFDPQIDIEEGFARYIAWFANSEYWNSKF